MVTLHGGYLYGIITIDILEKTWYCKVMSTLIYISISLDIYGIAISLVVLLCLLFEARTNPSRRSRMNKIFRYIVLFNIGFLLADIAAWVVTGNTETYALHISRIANYFYYVLPIFFLTALTLYMNDYFHHKAGNTSKRPRKITCIILGVCAVSVIMSTISQFNHMYYFIDEFNVYHRSELYWISQIFPALGTLLNIGDVILQRRVYKRRATFFFLLHFLLPFVTIFAQMMFYGLTLTNMATTLTVMVLYMCVQLEYSKDMEDELTDSRISVMLSQIQPHFLYNILNTIENLCYKDSEIAAKTVQDFSVYLRNNMDSLKQRELVSFRREIQHTKVYLELEKQRFGERLNVEFNFETDEFNLPVLTIQPLVENAVRHGIVKKQSGGTVTVSTKRLADCIEIVISDNGAGFTPESGKTRVSRNNARTHVGIENVRSRLISQCGGTLKVESTKGIGTECTIVIPKK